RDLETLHALYRAYAQRGDLDRRFNVAHALTFLGAATPEELTTYAHDKVQGLIRPTTSLTQEGWRRLLFHPAEEGLTGEIFGAIVSAVVLGRVSALRRDKALAVLDPAKKQDPEQSTLQGVRCFHWAAAILGMKAPPIYADPDFAGAAEMVPGVPPSTRLGQKA